MIDEKPLTDRQMRALHVASRYAMRAGNKLGASLDIVRDLAKRGYLERVGTINNVPYYRLTSIGLAIVQRTK